MNDGFYLNVGKTKPVLKEALKYVVPLKLLSIVFKYKSSVSQASVMRNAIYKITRWQ